MQEIKYEKWKKNESKHDIMNYFLIAIITEQSSFRI